MIKEHQELIIKNEDEVRKMIKEHQEQIDDTVSQMREMHRENVAAGLRRIVYIIDSILFFEPRILMNVSMSVRDNSSEDYENLKYISPWIWKK